MRHPRDLAMAIELYLDDCFRRGTAPRVDELARRLGRTPLQLSRAFERETGLQLGRYLRERQVEHACHLLSESNAPLEEVSRLSGFTVSRSFFRAFKTITGVSPASYRREKSVTLHRS